MRVNNLSSSKGNSKGKTHKDAYACLAFPAGNVAYFRKIPDLLPVILDLNVNCGGILRLLWGSRDVENSTRPMTS